MDKPVPTPRDQDSELSGAALLAGQTPPDECSDEELLKYAEAAIARNGYWTLPTVVRWLAEYVVRAAGVVSSPK